ncbi:hypothetical protein L218DRAFT_950548 [Marasmius fiardii PR-910]|nr:hypothetical protein L218DRAFT_950548 [Marasmius fiardii PR-910]
MEQCLALADEVALEVSRQCNQILAGNDATTLHLWKQAFICANIPRIFALIPDQQLAKILFIEECIYCYNPVREINWTGPTRHSEVTVTINIIRKWAKGNGFKTGILPEQSDILVQKKNVHVEGVSLGIVHARIVTTIGYGQLSNWPGLIHDLYHSIHSNLAGQESSSLSTGNSYSHLIELLLNQWSQLNQHASNAHLAIVMDNISSAAFFITCLKLGNYDFPSDTQKLQTALLKLVFCNHLIAAKVRGSVYTALVTFSLYCLVKAQPTKRSAPRKDLIWAQSTAQLSLFAFIKEYPKDLIHLDSDQEGDTHDFPNALLFSAPSATEVHSSENAPTCPLALSSSDSTPTVLSPVTSEPIVVLTKHGAVMNTPDQTESEVAISQSHLESQPK